MEGLPGNRMSQPAKAYCRKAGSQRHEKPPSNRGLFCVILLVMLTNLIFAAFTGWLAYHAGVSVEIAFLVAWVTLRLEAVATSFNLLTGAMQAQAMIENARLVREQAMYEGAVAQVAQNN